MKKCWCTDRLEELRNKGRENWDEDDYEAYCYCLNTLSEQCDDDEWNEIQIEG